MVALAPLRCPLFVPADRPDRFAKAAASGADAVILDLEDAVAPEAKDRARASLATGFCDLPVIVRINPTDTPWHRPDIQALKALRPDAVMLPKAQGRADLSALAEALPGLPVVALIETALGLAEVRRLAAMPDVVQLGFGSIDFCADLGIEHRADILRPVRLELVLASRLAGIAPPLDGVTARLDDPADLRADAAEARALGMAGKLCIHPRQIAPLRQAFRPSQAELDWARRVLASGDGAVAVDGTMVDEPVRRRARAIMAAAKE